MQRIRRWLADHAADRKLTFYSLMPLLAILLFIGTMFLLLRLLLATEMEQVRGTLLRDTEWAHQSMRLHLQLNQDSLSGIARDISQGRMDELAFQSQTRDYMALNPELEVIFWTDENRQIRWLTNNDRMAESKFLQRGQTLRSSETATTFAQARAQEKTIYSRPYVGPYNEVLMEVQVPAIHNGKFVGTVTGVYSMLGLMQQVVPREIPRKYTVMIVDEGGKTLASTSPRTTQDPSLSYELAIDPPGQGILLRTYAFRTHSELTRSVLFWLVIGLSVVIIWSLAMLWRHTRRRMEAERARDRLFSVSLDILAVLHLNGVIERINPAIARVLGHESQELTGQSIEPIIHPHDREKFLTQVARLQFAKTESETAISFECRCERRLQDKNGERHIEYRWIAWALKLDLQSPHHDRMIYAVAHDITERKHAEAALLAETAFRRAMEDSMLTGMRAFDREGKITYVNPAFCRMIGWREQELIGQIPPFPYWPPNDLEAQWDNLNMVLAGRAPETGFEVRVQRRDHTEFDARMYVSPLIDSHGRHSGWMTSMTDITEPKRIREELAAAHERFTTVLDELDAAVSVTAASLDLAYAGQRNPPQELLFANQYYQRLFGESTRGHEQLSRRPGMAYQTQSGRPAGGAKTITIYEIHDTVSNRWFEVRQRAIEWVDGRTARIQIATDISSRKEAEEMTRQQQEKLQLTSRLTTMGEMASSLAHELNQPLTAIANYSMGVYNRVRDGRMEQPDLLNALEKTSQQAERAGKIIRRIREFVKRSEPNRRPCDIRTIIDNAVSFADIEAKKKSVAIQVHIPSDLPTVQADPILIEQVLLNLLKNGVEAMHNSVERALQLQVEVDTETVKFVVQDHGTGIAPDHIPKLFEPFFSTKAEGMGMGLNICRSIIEFHHGRLWVESQLGVGSRFFFTLPL